MAEDLLGCEELELDAAGSFVVGEAGETEGSLQVVLEHVDEHDGVGLERVVGALHQPEPVAKVLHYGASQEVGAG